MNQQAVRSISYTPAAADFDAPAANTAAVVTKAADSIVAHAVEGVDWSYSTDPTNGSLIISIGGTDIYKLYITKGGPGVLSLPMKTAKNQALVATLAAGGAGVSGSVNLVGYRAEGIH